jgi:hypothetical protein
VKKDKAPESHTHVHALLFSFLGETKKEKKRADDR